MGTQIFSVSPQIANPQILGLIPQSQNRSKYMGPQIANPQMATFAEGPQI